MERNLAVLIDFENIATGCEKEGLGRFDVRAVMRRLKDKGRILTARSYADWGRFHRFKVDQMLEGVTMVELTSHGMQDKNRADIALAVDAMEIAYTRSYIDTFVILSGDSDFTPLVMRLKELNKRVIGCGTRGSTSRLIAEVCDEFLFYDAVRHETRVEVQAAEDEGGLTLDEAYELLVETVENHQRDEEPAPVHASILKAGMKRKAPTFNEVELGFRTFAKFLEAAEKRNLVALSPDPKAGGVRVDLKNDEPRREVITLSGPAATCMQALQADGWDIGTATDRRVVTTLLVGVCQERARRNRKCAVQWVLGDLLRRVKQEKVHIPARVVKGIVNGVVKSGALVHADGDPVRSGSATFAPPEDADALRQTLEGAAMEVLVARGLTDATALAEIFGGAATEARENGRREGAGRRESDRAREGGNGGRRAGERAEVGSASPPVVAEAGVVTEAAPEAAGEPEEKPKRPRRRRGGARGATQDGGADAGGDGGENLATPAAAPDTERAADEVASEAGAELGDDATAPARRRRRSRGGRRSRSAREGGEAGDTEAGGDVGPSDD